MRNNEDIDYTTNHIYATDLFTDKAIDFINNHNISQPMYLMVNHLAPHAGNAIFPLEVPKYAFDRFGNILGPIRRKYAAAVSVMDDSIGKIIKALDQKNMLKNSVILFLTDNGAPTVGEFYNKGSNYPLKGVIKFN